MDIYQEIYCILTFIPGNPCRVFNYYKQKEPFTQNSSFAILSKGFFCYQAIGLLYN